MPASFLARSLLLSHGGNGIYYFWIWAVSLHWSVRRQSIVECIFTIWQQKSKGMKYLYLSISIDIFVHCLDLGDWYSRLIIFQYRHSIVYKSVKCRHLIIHINNEHLQEKYLLQWLIVVKETHVLVQCRIWPHGEGYGSKPKDSHIMM